MSANDKEIDKIYLLCVIVVHAYANGNHFLYKYKFQHDSILIRIFNFEKKKKRNIERINHHNSSICISYGFIII